MLRGSSIITAMVLTLISGQTLALTVLPEPKCVQGDLDVYVINQLQGELTLATGRVQDGKSVVLLASCASNTQLVVTEATEDFSSNFVTSSINASVSSADTFTFEDLTRRFDTRRSTSEIKPISAALCTCLTKER